VATEWANLDSKKDDADTEISEQVSEPGFIEDDVKSVTEDEADPSEQENSDGVSRRLSRSHGDGSPATPATPTPVSRAQKRQRLEELAASRSSKKQRV
ncbi:hypothetical protein FRC17_008026, partial [Serendipita sp. 399]